MKKNPMAMVGTVERCWLFAFRTPVEDAAARLPAPLTPVTRDGFAFWNVVVCRVGSMRPRLVPRFLGMSYWHVAYRLYARFQPATGRPIEGLHFLRSDCDRPLLAAMGNLVTDFRFHTAEVTVEEHDSRLRLRIGSPDAPARAEVDRRRPVDLSPGSPFRTVEEAAAFLKYQPAGLSVEPDGRVNVVRIGRDERAWRATPVAVTEQHWSFLEGMPALPELATEVDPIRYHWHSGERVEARPC
jgi:hypothetical protein